MYLKLVNKALVVMADKFLQDCSLPLAIPLLGGEVVSLVFTFMASLSGFPAKLTITSKFGNDFYYIGTCTSRFNCSKIMILVSDRFSKSPAIS